MRWSATQPQTTHPANNTTVTPCAQKSITTYSSSPFNAVSELLTFILVAWIVMHVYICISIITEGENRGAHYFTTILRSAEPALGSVKYNLQMRLVTLSAAYGVAKAKWRATF